ncbi:hypothetical protein EGI11_05130 [Chryseobacterium sp. H3056]|uniref:Uncharacterized protein n=1 Tax=Kaistella daneshvariae TaxID=2487074 RepID=A0A3N0WUS4_9FLAO|nr:hypothetical protein EGI11_05130 [Kaistella daneshvariae]
MLSISFRKVRGSSFKNLFHVFQIAKVRNFVQIRKDIFFKYSGVLGVSFGRSLTRALRARGHSLPQAGLSAHTPRARA